VCVCVCVCVYTKNGELWCKSDREHVGWGTVRPDTGKKQNKTKTPNQLMLVLMMIVLMMLMVVMVC